METTGTLQGHLYVLMIAGDSHPDLTFPNSSEGNDRELVRENGRFASDVYEGTILDDHWHHNVLAGMHPIYRMLLSAVIAITPARAWLG